MATGPNSNAETTLEQQAGESPSDVKSLLKALGLTPSSTMQEFAEAVQKSGGLQPAQPAQSNPLSTIANAVGGAVNDVGSQVGKAYDQTLGRLTPVAQYAAEFPVQPAAAVQQGIANEAPSVLDAAKKDLIQKQTSAPDLGSPQDAAKGAKKDPKKAAATSPTPSPYEQLADSLASMYLQQVNQLEPLISGSGLYGPQGQTTQAAQTAGAAVPGAAGWLSGLASQEQKDAAPMQAAMSNVGNAEASGALGVANAIGNTGTANTEYLQAAPFQQFLSELANETAYKAASSGSSAFGSGPIANSPLIQNLFKQLGLSASPAGTGTSVGGARQASTGGTQGTTSATSGGGNPSSPSG